MARILAGKGYHLLLVARDKNRMEKLCRELTKETGAGCEYLVCDLSLEPEADRLIGICPETDLLVNNAGFSRYGFFKESSWQIERDIIMVNVFALTRLCHHYVKGMVERNYGRILNVASTAGMVPAPFFSTYVGAKAFVIQFSKSLALELKDTDVSVTTVLPGPTATGFWEVANMAAKIEKQFKYFASPQAVAEFSINLMETGKMWGIPGWKNRAKKIIKDYLPEKLWFYMIRRHMEHDSLYDGKDK